MIRSGSGMSAVSSRRRDRFGVDLLGREPSLRHHFRQRARGRGDLLPRAVIESDHQSEPGVGLRHLLGLAQQIGNVGREVGARADDAHAHIAGVQFGEIVADEAMQQRQAGFPLPRAAATSFRPKTNRPSDNGY